MGRTRGIKISAIDAGRSSYSSLKCCAQDNSRRCIRKCEFAAPLAIVFIYTTKTKKTQIHVVSYFVYLLGIPLPLPRNALWAAPGACFSGLNGVDLDETGFPHKGGHVIPNALVLEVDTGPDVALSVFNAESVQDIGSIETSIVAKLSGNDLECLGEGLDDTLLLVGDLAVGVGVKVFADLHFASTTTSNNALVLDGTLDDHDGIVQTALDFGNELFSATAEDKGACLCARATLEEVPRWDSWMSEQVDWIEAPVDWHTRSMSSDATRPAQKMSRSAKYLFESHLVKGFHLVVDNLPFGIDNGLVF
ncbi:hypothetical protein KCU81_g493, partial [Aureobasidium melanogenum]